MYEPSFEGTIAKGTVPALRSVQFTNVRLDPSFIERLAKSPWLANLRELRVTQCPDDIDYDPWNFPAMLRSLEANVPDLEVFEWTISGEYIDDDVPFDTFRGLKKLRSPEFDFESLVPWAQVNSLFTPLNPGSIFSESLESITVHKIPCSAARDIMGLIRRQVEAAGDGTAARTKSKQLLTTRPSLKHVQLNVDMEVLDSAAPDDIEPRELVPCKLDPFIFVLKQVAGRIWNLNNGHSLRPSRGLIC